MLTKAAQAGPGAKTLAVLPVHGAGRRPGQHLATAVDTFKLGLFGAVCAHSESELRICAAGPVMQPCLQLQVLHAQGIWLKLPVPT